MPWPEETGRGGGSRRDSAALCTKRKWFLAQSLSVLPKFERSAKYLLRFLPIRSSMQGVPQPEGGGMEQAPAEMHGASEHRMQEAGRIGRDPSDLTSDEIVYGGPPPRPDPGAPNVMA